MILRQLSVNHWKEQSSAILVMKVSEWALWLDRNKWKKYREDYRNWWRSHSLYLGNLNIFDVAFRLKNQRSLFATDVIEKWYTFRTHGYAWNRSFWTHFYFDAVCNNGRCHRTCQKRSWVADEPIVTYDDNIAREYVINAATHHGRILVLNRNSAKRSTGHGSPMPLLVHGRTR